MFSKPTIEIDFEFNSSTEAVPNLVCCSLMIDGDPSTVREWWLLNNTPEQKNLGVLLSKFRETHFFIAHAATAESRCFIALGLNPTKFQWLDTYLERRQLTNKCNQFSYGRYFDKEGVERFSVVPSFQEWKNVGKDNTELRNSYSVAVGRHLGICVDLEIKDEMRDVILTCDDTMIESRKDDIIKYCTSDIVHLRPLIEQLTYDIESVTRLSVKEIERASLFRGRFAADTAKMETVGIPLNVEQVSNLVSNYDIAKEWLIIDLVTTQYPFFVKEKDTKFKSRIAGTWKFKQDKMVQFIEGENLGREWPRTDPTRRAPYGFYKTDKDTLSKYKTIPQIAALLEVNKQVGQLKWFRPLSENEKVDGEFMDAVGSDMMLRPFYNPYGTQTGRNAPPAKKFILAMSSWLRCLIQAPEGEVIVAADYSSQEFAVAAVLSNDTNMGKAYESGDPYLFLAKMAKVVPAEAEPYKCKNPAFVLSKNPATDYPHGVTKADRNRLSAENPKLYDEYMKFCKYEEARTLFKSCTLGLQFGMGVESLAKDIASSRRLPVNIRETQKLVDQHKRTYRKFWAWVDKQIKKYKREKSLSLSDGWTLLGDNDNDLSVKNFPVQGTAAVIMREAVSLAHEKGLAVMCPLHDALYIRCTEAEQVEHTELLKQAMTEAVSNIIGDSITMRIDVDVHKRDDVWIEAKGRDNYEKLSKFLRPYVDTQRTNRMLVMSAIKGAE